MDRAEVAATFDAFAAVAGCRVRLTLVDHGSGLFELLDRNADGRLSPRELAEAGRGLMPFARARMGVTPGDLPRRFQAIATSEPIPVVSAPAERAVDQRKLEPPSPDVPGWVAKLDRNGDGDVSRREVPGPLETFRGLDVDGDGLISPAEAIRSK